MMIFYQKKYLSARPGHPFPGCKLKQGICPDILRKQSVLVKSNDTQVVPNPVPRTAVLAILRFYNKSFFKIVVNIFQFLQEQHCLGRKINCCLISVYFETFHFFIFLFVLEGKSPDLS